MTETENCHCFCLKKPGGLEISQSLVEKSSYLPAYFMQCHAEQLRGRCSDLPLAQVRPASSSSDNFFSFTCLSGTS